MGVGRFVVGHLIKALAVDDRLRRFLPTLECLQSLRVVLAVLIAQGELWR